VLLAKPFENRTLVAARVARWGGSFPR
jgi:hypothetical protein